MIEGSYWLKQGDPTLVIDLDGISNNDCSYELSLLQDGHDADPEIFRLSPPTFKQSELNQLHYEPERAGQLLIQGQRRSQVGSYSLELIVKSGSLSETVVFDVSIEACKSVA